MTKKKKMCRICGKKLDSDKEQQRGICDEDLHKGYTKLGEVLGKMKQEHGKG